MATITIPKTIERPDRVRVGWTVEIPSPFHSAGVYCDAIILGNYPELFGPYDSYDANLYGVLCINPTGFGGKNIAYCWINQNVMTVLCTNESRGIEIIKNNLKPIQTEFGDSTSKYIDELRLGKYNTTNQ